MSSRHWLIATSFKGSMPNSAGDNAAGQTHSAGSFAGMPRQSGCIGVEKEAKNWEAGSIITAIWIGLIALTAHYIWMRAEIMASREGLELRGAIHSTWTAPFSWKEESTQRRAPCGLIRTVSLYRPCNRGYYSIS